jgi:hypothetical protein
MYRKTVKVDIFITAVDFLTQALTDYKGYGETFEVSAYYNVLLQQQMRFESIRKFSSEIFLFVLSKPKAILVILTTLLA